MSKPKHIYVEPEDAEYLSENSELHGIRYTLTEGEEWDALIVRVRTALATPNYTNAMLKADALRDLLDYFGETP